MLFLPEIALAQSVFDNAPDNPAVMNLIGGVMNWIVIPILEGFFLFTFLVFVWGVVQMIRAGDDPSARETGRNHVLWGVIGIAIMFSSYGIIRVIENTIYAPAPAYESRFK